MYLTEDTRKSLTDEDAGVLLHTLIGWLIQSVQNSEREFVIRKICSTLVAYWLQFHSSWGKCIKHLIYCFCANEAVPYAAMSSAPETNDLIQNLSDVKAIPILWFAATLVDEVNKTDSNSVKQLSKWSEILELHH